MFDTEEFSVVVREASATINSLAETDVELAVVPVDILNTFALPVSRNIPVVVHVKLLFSVVPGEYIPIQFPELLILLFEI